MSAYEAIRLIFIAMTTVIALVTLMVYIVDISKRK